MASFLTEHVVSVHHWTDKLFSFTTTRSNSLRFKNGHFIMIGLEVNGKPLMRAYSMVNAHYDDHLEFLSIKVPNGPLTSRLQHVKAGDKILVNRKTTGTLITDNLLPGKNLYLLATGTGLAPFLSIIRDPVVYEKFDRVILIHSCRHVSELVYDDLILRQLPENEFFGDFVQSKLTYYPTVTREAFHNQGRITDLIKSGKLFEDLGEQPFDKDADRIMICGNPNMMTELSEYLDGIGFLQGTNAEPGHYVIEKAFAEK